MPGQLSGQGNAHGSGTWGSSFFLVSGRRWAAFFRKSFPLAPDDPPAYCVLLQWDSSCGTPRQTYSPGFRPRSEPSAHRPSYVPRHQCTCEGSPAPVPRPAGQRILSALFSRRHSACRYPVQTLIPRVRSSVVRSAPEQPQTTTCYLVGLLDLLSCCRQPVGCCRLPVTLPVTANKRSIVFYRDNAVF